MSNPLGDSPVAEANPLGDSEVQGNPLGDSRVESSTNPLGDSSPTPIPADQLSPDFVSAAENTMARGNGGVIPLHSPTASEQVQIDRYGEIRPDTTKDQVFGAARGLVRPVIGYFKRAHEDAGVKPIIGYGDVQGTLATIPHIPTDSLPQVSGYGASPAAIGGVLNALGETGASFTSPEGIALLGGVGKLVSAAKNGSGVASWAARALSAWFAKNAAESAGGKLGEASVTGDVKTGTEGVLDAAMALGAGEVARKPLVPPPAPRAAPTTQSTADALGYLDLNRTDAVSKWVHSDNPREAIVYAKDAVNTATERAANTAANDVLHDLKQNFEGSDLDAAQRALVPAVEAGGDVAKLEDMKQTLESGTYADKAQLGRAHEYINDINFAIDNIEELAPAVAKHQEITSAIYDHAQDSGIEFPKRDNYVLHAQDFEVPEGFEEASGGGTGASMAFKKMRVYDTYADSIAAGVEPKTTNGIDLLRSAVRATQGAVNRNLWTDALTEMTDPTNKAPIVVPREVVTRPDGSTYLNTPPGYAPAEVGGRPMAIQNGYKGLFDALTSPSSVDPTLSKINGTAKSIRLAVDTYHLGRLAAYQAASELSRGEAPVPKYERGLLIGDMPMRAIEDMAAKGEIDPASLPQIREDKAIIDLTVNHGLNAGRIADSLHQEWIQKVPMLGDVNKFIFQQFQRGAIYDMAVKEFRYQQERFPGLSDEEVARNVAKDINTRLGNLGSQGLFKSRTAQDMARLVFLAPQWNEALIRSEAGGIKQLAQSVPDTLKSGRFTSGLLGRVAATLAVGQFAANQLINLYTRGHPTWENPEDSLGAKLSAWVPDKVGSSHGFFLNPMTLPAEVTHLLEKSFERTGDWRDAVGSYFRGRLSGAAQPVADVLLKRDAMGRPLTTTGALKDAIPVPIATSTVGNAIHQAVTGEKSESYPGQYQKQAMASFGLRADLAPAPEQRIRSLATDYIRNNGLKERQFPENAGADFQPLNTALRAGNTKEATDALVQLLKSKTLAEVVSHYQHSQQSPFTGNGKYEAQFFMSLNPEERQAYKQAMIDRAKHAATAINFVIQQVRGSKP